MGKIIINGKETNISGTLQYRDGTWYIDGKEVNLEDLGKEKESLTQGNNCSCPGSKEKERTVIVDGNLENLTISSGQCKVIVKGNIEDLVVSSGVVTVEGNVGGDVAVTGGSVTCGKIGGDLGIFGGVVNC